MIYNMDTNNIYKSKMTGNKMNTLKRGLNSRRFIASFISISILTLLFLAGPAQAFILGLTVDNDIPSKGDSITFTATLDIERMDRYLPVKNLTLVLDGPEYTQCIFDVMGNVLSGCENMTITPLFNSYSQGYGYGYGYDSDNGYGYDFGYGYGYDSDNGYGYGYDSDNGYGYGYGAGEITLKYEITLDTTDYLEGNYDTMLMAHIGDEIFSKDGLSITIVIPLTEDDEDDEDDEDPSTSSHNSNRFNYGETTFNQTTGDNSTQEDDPILRVEGDEIPGSKEGFFKGFTGAVLGALGTGGSIIALVFIVSILGTFVFVVRKRRAKL
jgi:hypothetical protein